MNDNNKYEKNTVHLLENNYLRTSIWMKKNQEWIPTAQGRRNKS